MGRPAKDRYHRWSDATDGCSPITQVDDLSRSLAAFDQNTSLVVVVEMSKASWLVAELVPGLDRQPLKKLEPNPSALLRLLERWQAEAMKAGQTIGRVTLAYKAGRDGFWLARDKCTGLCTLNPSKNQAFGKPPAIYIRDRFSALSCNYNGLRA